jgi:hypothetical protein
MNSETMNSFVNDQIEKVFEIASVNLKEKLNTEFKDLLNELEDSKEKFRKTMTSESHKQMNTVVGHPNNTQKIDITINTSKIEIINRVKMNLNFIFDFLGLININFILFYFYFIFFLFFIFLQKIASNNGIIFYDAIVDGWKCAMKELDVSKMKEKALETFENELLILERLPYHKNLEKIMFHMRNQNSIRIFVTKHKKSFSSYLYELSNKKKYLSVAKIVKLSLDIVKGIFFFFNFNFNFYF